MIYAFTEKEKRKIEGAGIMVVQFKMFLKKRNAYEELTRRIAEMTETICIVFEKAVKRIDCFLEDIKYALEEISYTLYSYESGRHRFVRKLSKCTGIEKKCIWTMTRWLYLPRSNC